MDDLSQMGILPNPAESNRRSVGQQAIGLVSGALMAIGVAFVLGLIWYGLDVYLHIRIWLLIVIFGFAIGFPVGIKSKAPPLISAIVASLVTVGCLAVLFYFIDRQAFVQAIPDQTIPFWTGWETAKSIVKIRFNADKLRYLLVPVTVGLAAWSSWSSAKDERPKPESNDAAR
jgi:hypothetical protein